MKKKANTNQKLLTILGGVFGLVLAYAFLSRAFSTGSYWQYLGAVLFLFLGVKLFVRAHKK